MAEQIAIESLIHHRKPLLLLDTVLNSGQDYINCALIVRSDGLFDHNGYVPASVGIEYMAQTVAAFAGLQAIRIGEQPRMGFLLGTRKFFTTVAEFPCGMAITVTATQALQTNAGMAAFDCTVEGSNLKQSATLTVFAPIDSDSYLAGART